MQSKCLMLIPHRFAIGCIDRGWVMRNDIIWAKRNGMPESCRDRFSKKHEYFFFMVKQQKYYFDLDGVRDKHSTPLKTGDAVTTNSKSFGMKEYGGQVRDNHDIHNCYNPSGKNPGDVSDFWDIPTKPSSKKHYATYNFDLIDKCIIAGCPEGGTILDPFNGTGTTTLRAEQLNRKWIGIDGSEEYSKIAKKSMKDEFNQMKLSF
nr:site-specific DNA-methyltransferase [Bacteroidota bacterium]